MTKIRCDICHDAFSLDQFRFLFCGHGFCVSCSDKTRKQKMCAVCRCRKGSDEPRQIFASFVETKPPQDKARTIIEGLDKIGVTSNAISIEKAGRKIKDLSLHVDKDVACELLEAAKNLEERILPLYSGLELEQTANITLRKQVEELERKVISTESLEKQISDLQRMLQSEKRKYEKVNALVNEERNHVAREMDENTRLNALVQRQRRRLEVKEEEIQKAQNEIAENEKKIGLLTRKLRALSKLDKKPKFRPQDPDESLQIEPLVASGNSMLMEADRDLQRTREPTKNNDFPPSKRQKTL